MDEAMPSSCFNCDDLGGGIYKAHEGDTVWHIGLDSNGQAHYACANCAPLLFNCDPIVPPSTRSDR